MKLWSGTKWTILAAATLTMTDSRVCSQHNQSGEQECLIVPFTAKAISSLDNRRCIQRHGQSEHRAEGSLDREKTHVESRSYGLLSTLH